MSQMVGGWLLPTAGITGETSLELIVTIGLTVIVFGIGFIGGNQR
jgi:hypothetical protein